MVHATASGDGETRTIGKVVALSILSEFVPLFLVIVMILT